MIFDEEIVTIPLLPQIPRFPRLPPAGDKVTCETGTADSNIIDSEMEEDTLFLKTKVKKIVHDLKWEIHDFSTFVPQSISEGPPPAPTLMPASTENGFHVSFNFGEFTYKSLPLALTMPIQMFTSDGKLWFKGSFKWTGACSRKFSFTAQFKLANPAGEVFASRYSRQIVVAGFTTPSKTSFSFDIISLSEIWREKDTNLPNDILNVCIDLTFSFSQNINSTQEIVDRKRLKQEATTKFLETFSDLRSQNADLKLVCGPECGILHVHKFILSARSPVFARMLESDMLESQTKIIKIEDIDLPTMSVLVDFIYTAKMDIDDFNVDKLYNVALAADKYELTQLLNYCFEEMVRKLDYKSVGQIGLAFYLCSQNAEYREIIWEYCSKNWLALREDLSFVKLTRDYPDAFFRPVDKYSRNNAEASADPDSGDAVPPEKRSKSNTNS